MGCLILSSLLCMGATGEVANRSATAHNQETLEMLLTKPQAAALFPELAQADPQAIRQTPRGKALLEWAKSAPDDIPPLTYTLFRLFKRTGDREAFKANYFGRRERLCQAAIAAWLEPDEPAHLSRVNDLVWAICEETTWVLPAHEHLDDIGLDGIDLFNAETAAQLADVVMLLGEHLPEDIRVRIYREVDRRIFANFLEHFSDYGWHHGGQNWTGACAGSIGEAALILEKDPARQAQMLAIVLGQLQRYVEKAFTEDGGCAEGIVYWDYGLLHYVAFARMLYAKTDGELDLLAHPKVKRIARYPMAVSTGSRQFVSFADSNESIGLAPSTTSVLAQRTGAQELLAFTDGLESWRLGTTLRNLLWWDGTQPETIEPTDVFLPDLGLVRLVGKASGHPILLCAKAGHNNESHNHNDVGSFVVAADGVVLLCDPGSGLYSRSYFNEHRYESIFTRSYGHSVPYIGGHQQAFGREYEGTMTQTGEKAIQIDFTKAYDIEELVAARRTLTLNADGTIVLVDSFEFANDGLEVQEAFMTWQDVEVDGNIARVTSKSGTLEIQAESGAFTVESFEDECRANKKDRTLKRIGLVCPLSQRLDATFHMTYTPLGN